MVADKGDTHRMRVAIFLATLYKCMLVCITEDR